MATFLETPKYLVFFKAKDADALNAAMNEYASRTLKKDERPSVLQTLKKFKEIVAKLPDKIRNKEQIPAFLLRWRNDYFMR